MQLYVGIEGGASSSKVVLLNHNAKILATLDDGPASNVWLIRREEWACRIHEMIKQIFQKANLPQVKLECLGLCLSGCEDKIENDKLSAYLQETYPSLCVRCKVSSDTVGSIMTASASGGIVLIAGTGSNSLYFESKTENSVRCGGWGHMIGDYGSAYWIANLAIRYVIEDEEGFYPLAVSTDNVRQAIYEHFGINSTMALLTPLYTKFDKTHFAHLCVKVAELAIKKKDALALRIFNDAGYILAQHICALLSQIKCASFKDIPVICVGSVFKSWPLLESGFKYCFNERMTSSVKKTNNSSFSKSSSSTSSSSSQSLSDISLSLRFLTQTSAIGAAYYAAQSFDITLPIDFTRNYIELSTLQSQKIVHGA